MQISCAFPPGRDTVEHVVLAEQLGYERAWMYDSPALYHDVWVALCRAAERTTKIGLGPAVLVANLRHPLTTAAAIATLAEVAPGRTVVAIGTGFTGRMAMGQKPLAWKNVREHIQQLQGLLRGETVEVDGSMVKMMQPEGYGSPRPIDVPIIVAANGPKGLEVAKELGAGVMTIGGGQPGFDWCAALTMGTVLDDGESAGSDRAMAAAGPGLTVVFHGTYESNPDFVTMLPGGAEWRAELEAIPHAVRHLATHEDHLVGVTERDQPLLDAALLQKFTWTGTRAEIASRIEAAAASGVTEILYAPMGPDVDRELRAFASAAGIG